MPLCDSAHSACVSRTFLRSWRCHPKLIFTEETLGLKRTEARDFTSRVNQILKNHSDTGVKILEFVFDDRNNVNTCHLNSWLQKAVTPGIEKITLFLPWRYREEYNFPCSILLDGRGNSIWYLDLTNCAFHPMVGFDCLRSLTKLRLYGVCITGDELGHLISNCFALEELQVWCCMELICSTIPFWLQRLSCLTVSECDMLRVIESTAPNLTTLDFFGEPVQLVLRESSKVKHLKVGYSYTPNATVNTPMVADKFLAIKHLNIHLGEDYDDAVTPTYDYLSLASFLDACPVLESFNLSVSLLFTLQRCLLSAAETFFFRENAEDLRFIALKRKGFQLHPPRRQLYRVRVLQLMYIPGLGNEGTQAQRAGSGPKRRLLLDFIQQRSYRRAGSVEDAVVPMLPQHPRNE
ncbi:hypothetical protein CFC21_048769 [Triticum aestivum]|uniref:At1g61320/AtMIF1 LRR domain-containing protein n=2 Tax=Triticum aestivum TaxID=4565 RepID=A0A9R1G0A8_WHEAT|nr:hypothetical protein CFC21_048769 [Triticum aestivum]